MKVAAVQLNAVFADVNSNLHQSEIYIKEAAAADAELVLLPEFFTSAIGFSERMLDVPTQNKKVQRLLKQWAAEYRVIIGGSYISFDGKDAFNLFSLVFPNGEVFEHKKDIPTQFENCYYTNGDENNVLHTPIGDIGVALCWEMIRYDTLKWLLGKADMILSGSCWWDLPKNTPPEKEPLRQYNQSLALETPVTFAKLLGVPLVHANHCGEIEALNFPNANKLQIRQFVGGAQIVDGKGKLFARKPFHEGGGFVIADIAVGTARRKNPGVFPPRYWIPDLPDSYIRAWETINPLGTEYYKTTALPYYHKHCI